uniref:Retrovirus-related Pol polyprotein from transposon TNT 1-94 n=1 Tax=Tanacetum cinerariifolium TaxID=118510 RepID=A0A6L2LLM9_TANCI|nr:retrovirus-related Pol polyprotein from transposon TNT 1-94 [Tanacetum cinerariifolium]
MLLLYVLLSSTSYGQTPQRDADHAGCKDDCKSTSGGLKYLSRKLVSWSSKKQDCTAMSTDEAEYVSLSACCTHVIWMRTKLLDYGYKYNQISMYCDSKSAIAISCNPVQHSKTKHINIRYYFIKEHFEKGTIELYFVGTEYQLVDPFTKALPKECFEYLVYCIANSMNKSSGKGGPATSYQRMPTRVLNPSSGNNVSNVQVEPEGLNIGESTGYTSATASPGVFTQPIASTINPSSFGDLNNPNSDAGKHDELLSGMTNDDRMETMDALGIICNSVQADNTNTNVTPCKVSHGDPIIQSVGVPKSTSYVEAAKWLKRCLIEVNSEVGLVDVVTIGIPSLTGDGCTKETIHVEYEWKPSRCDLCKIFGHDHDHFPKKKKKKKGKSRSNNGGQFVGPSVKQNVIYEPKTTTSAPKREPLMCLNVEDDEDEEHVENVYDETTNLFNTKTSEGSSFTAAVG